MASRLSLQTELEQILGSRNVYYQPPASVRMHYPAIVYERDNIQSKFADNVIYTQDNAYQVTVIDEDPDSEIVSAISKLPSCKFSTHYTADNLNHDVFILFY